MFFSLFKDIVVISSRRRYQARAGATAVDPHVPDVGVPGVVAASLTGPDDDFMLGIVCHASVM